MALPNDTEILLSIAFQLMAVGLFAVIAGINDEVGTLVVIFMVGMWILFMATDSAVIQKIGNTFTKGISV